ncbi:MAG: RdgB/HAM1 family non-canonical purine NTP pyrophosphatase [Bacteroidia bacterium]
MKKIVFASSNPGKIEEIRSILGKSYQVLGLKDINFNEEIIENGSTFEENAQIKADRIFEYTGLPCFADDSGLEVNCLNNAPSIYSARFAGEPSDSKKNNVLLLEKMKGEIDRSAQFVCVICLKTKDNTLFFKGIVEGEIAESMSGKEGFGYDPLFIPRSYTQTFADLGKEVKNKISHRKVALNKLQTAIDTIL